MVICEYCNRDMIVAASCVVTALYIDGVEFATVPYGEETTHYRRSRPTQRCQDCGIRPGGRHHPGCDWAQCPRCRQQLLSCGCRVDRYTRAASEAAERTGSG